MLLMISTINFHYALGKEAAHTRPVYGPATEAQRASHMRLSVAADALVDRAPSDMVLQDCPRSSARLWCLTQAKRS